MADDFTSKEQSSASKMLDDLLGEGLGDEPVSGKTAFSAPVLPKIKLVLPSVSAPVTVKKRGGPAAKKAASVTEILPQIIKEMQAPKPVYSDPMAPAEVLPPEGGALLPLVPGPIVRKNSRIKKRHEMVFGKTVHRAYGAKRWRDSVGRSFGDDEKKIYQEFVSAAKPAGARGPFASSAFLAWFFLLPALIVFFLFSWLPMLRSLIISFTRFRPVGESTFIGLANYQKALSDTLLGQTWMHAGVFCLLSLVLGFWIPVGLALFFNEIKRGQTPLKLAFFLPFLTPVVPAAITWRWILDQGYGLINSALSYLPISNPHVPWLNHPQLAMLSLVVVFIWKNTGWNALIYLTSLQGVPNELYEVAEMDGTSIWQRVRQVSLPYLRATMGVLFILQILNTVQIFTEVYLMTDGGPAHATEMIATYLYKKSFLYLDVGYASAMAVMLFVFLISFTTIRMRQIGEEA